MPFLCPQCNEEKLRHVEPIKWNASNDEFIAFTRDRRRVCACGWAGSLDDCKLAPEPLKPCKCCGELTTRMWCSNSCFYQEDGWNNSSGGVEVDDEE